MAGWLVQVKTTDGRGERAADWIVASSDWMKASKIARDTALREATQGSRVINTRVLREASASELAGTLDDQAKRR